MKVFKIYQYLKKKNNLDINNLDINNMKKLFMKNNITSDNITLDNITSDNIKKCVINLKRRGDRLKKFFHNCPFDDVEIIYGFDGKNSNYENNYDKDKMKKFNKLKLGEIGCFISHIRIYEYMINNNLESMLIMEDDAIFCYSFINKFNLIKNELESNQNIIFIGGRFTPDYLTLKRNYMNISNKKYIIKHNKTSKSSDLHRTTHAYIIYKNCALNLLNEFNNSIIITNAFDHWIIKILQKNNLDIHSTLPLLCHSPFIGNSDIR